MSTKAIADGIKQASAIVHEWAKSHDYRVEVRETERTAPPAGWPFIEMAFFAADDGRHLHTATISTEQLFDWPSLMAYLDHRVTYEIGKTEAARA